MGFVMNKVHCNKNKKYVGSRHPLPLSLRNLPIGRTFIALMMAVVLFGFASAAHLETEWFIIDGRNLVELFMILIRGGICIPPISVRAM